MTSSTSTAGGADKFSRYLAGYLTETFAPAATTGEDEALWQQRTEHFSSLLTALQVS